MLDRPDTLNTLSDKVRTDDVFRDRVARSFGTVLFFGLMASSAIRYELRILNSLHMATAGFAAATLLLAAYLNTVTHYKALSRYLVTLSMIPNVFAASWQNGGLQAPIVAFIPFIPVLGTFLNGRPGLWFSFSASLLLYVTISYFSLTQQLTGNLLSTQQKAATTSLVIGATLMLTSYLAFIYEKMRNSHLQSLKEEHRQLTSTLADLKNLLDGLPGLVLLCSKADLSVITMNGEASLILITDENDAKSKPLEAVLGAHIANQAAQKLHLHGGQFQGEVGSRRYLFTVSHPGPSNFVILCGADMTSLHEAQVELDRERERSASTAKLAAIGEVASGIAHEINNPLTVISATTLMLKKRLEKSGEAEVQTIEKVEKIEKATKRIHRIIHGMRTLSRDGGHDPFVAEDLAILVDDAKFMIETRLANAEVQLRCDPLPSGAMLQCRSVQIVQIITNLLSNAIDAAEGSAENWVHLQMFDDHDTVRVEVRDSGPGIPEDIRAKLFAAFFTTKGQGKGTGLGLSLSQRFAQEHGGNLTLMDGVPTCFCLTLPKVQTASKPLDVAS